MVQVENETTVNENDLDDESAYDVHGWRSKEKLFPS